MGYIYKVAVPQGRWPTARALDEVLQRDGAVRILTRADQCDAPFRTSPDESFAALVDDCPHILDSRDYVFDRDNDTFELREIMEIAGMDTARLEGAHIFSVTTHRSERDWRVAGAVMKALVRDFGGYGMDFQTNSAGTHEWADALDATLASDRQAYLAMVDEIEGREPSRRAAAPDCPDPVKTRRHVFARLTEMFGNRGVPPGRRHLIDE